MARIAGARQTVRVTRTELNCHGSFARLLYYEMRTLCTIMIIVHKLNASGSTHIYRLHVDACISRHVVGLWLTLFSAANINITLRWQHCYYADGVYSGKRRCVRRRSVRLSRGVYSNWVARGQHRRRQRTFRTESVLGPTTVVLILRAGNSNYSLTKRSFSPCSKNHVIDRPALLSIIK